MVEMGGTAEDWPKEPGQFAFKRGRDAGKLTCGGLGCTGLRRGRAPTTVSTTVSAAISAAISSTISTTIVTTIVTSTGTVWNIADTTDLANLEHAMLNSAVVKSHDEYKLCVLNEKEEESGSRKECECRKD